TDAAKTAYRQIIDLRFKEAQPLIDRIKKETPNNLVVYHLENYIDFLTVYIEEDKEAFARAEIRKNQRLRKIENGDRKSPYYLYLQADMRMQWALARIKFEEWFGAFKDINQAYKLLEKNEAQFPDFMPNKKDLGIIHAMVSSVPSGIEWISSLEGDLKKGKRELQEVIRYASKNDFLFEQETYILYAYVLMQFGNDEEGAWKIINQSKLNPKASPTAAFLMANIAMKSGYNDEAIQILEQCAKGTKFHPFPYLEYMLGLAKLHRLDGDADQALKRYLQNFKGRDYIKQSYRLLAWHELVHDRPAGYQKYMQKALTEGNTFLGADESAMQEAQNGVAPNKDILKARLLFDGGYFQRAYNMLILQSNKQFEHQKTELEYHYFLARSLHSLKRYDEALKQYKFVISKGRNATWYYACRAALESGRIYEILKDKKRARVAYEDCVTIRPKEHRYDLHQKAKTQLKKLEN
ncbi:MAG: hypothetical protein AAGG68_26870, partial [Bacteroidota bacterium]